MTWTWLVLLIALAVQQEWNHRRLVARLSDINTDVDALVRAREELAAFLRRRVTERVAEFKAGGGRERLRERLAQKQG